jgi:proteasome lid subunit RPN8/RPN11
MLQGAAVRFKGLVRRACRWLGTLESSLSAAEAGSPVLDDSAGQIGDYEPLKRIVLTDQVSRTLFQEYTAHLGSKRGEEETGWDLVGLRDRDQAVVMATLPAGARRDAGASHVQFNRSAQALGFRVLRQTDKRLVMLGVAHTHPGSLRHPSEGDFQGDSEWVGKLRGREGIFAIGTADGPGQAGDGVAQAVRPNTLALNRLVFSWYALASGDNRYRALDVHLTIGPDLAFPLHSVWPIIEEHADPLDRLCRQQRHVSFSVVPGRNGPGLVASIKLAEVGHALRVVLDAGQTAFYMQRGAEFLAVPRPSGSLDQACYLILAELAGQGKLR